MKIILIGIIKGYRLCISPMLPRSCRYAPSCSEYAIDALKQKGIIKGLFLTTKRILKCHPFCKGGYDPVK